MTFYPRRTWGARPTRGATRLNRTQVKGIAFHWPAMAKPLTNPAAVMAALRGWQIFHMDTRKWADIAYQLAFDQDGNVYQLRGIGNRSGANGDTATNSEYGAFLLVLAPGEEPSDRMVKAVRRRVPGFRRMYPRAVDLVGHGEIRPGGTECPGPAVRRCLAEDAFEPDAPARPLPTSNPGPVKKAAKKATKKAAPSKEK